MKKIKIEKTKIAENLVKMRGDENKELDYKDLIEVALDIIPQGGFTPKDIRNRNRIQDVLDRATTVIILEDADFEELENIIKDSRWTLRDPEINEFLRKFNDGDYKKEEEEKEKSKPSK